jgi:hypothetical protein
MSLKGVCVKINALFCLGSAFVILWGFNAPSTTNTIAALICLPVCPAAGLGWRAAGTGRGMRAALVLAGMMLPYAAWIWFKERNAGLCFPALLGVLNLCLLPGLKKLGEAPPPQTPPAGV